MFQLKTQMWQLLKGHDHLQDEFSVFFDHLRPSASRMGDFEEINWTEEKEYEVGVDSPRRVSARVQITAAFPEGGMAVGGLKQAFGTSNVIGLKLKLS